MDDQGQAYHPPEYLKDSHLQKLIVDPSTSQFAQVPWFEASSWLRFPQLPKRTWRIVHENPWLEDEPVGGRPNLQAASYVSFRECSSCGYTLIGTIILRTTKASFESMMVFPFPQVGCVTFMEDNLDPAWKKNLDDPMDWLSRVFFLISLETSPNFPKSFLSLRWLKSWIIPRSPYVI